MGRVLVVVLLFVALALPVLAGPQPVARKGELTIAIDSFGSESLDPIVESRPAHAHLHAPMFDSLTGFDIERGGVGPGVAERWDLSPDGQTWTFHLRPGLTFHNGDPLTADDVKFSLERITSRESQTAQAATLRNIIASIDVVDPQTVRVRTKGIYPYFAAWLSRAIFHDGTIMPKRYIESRGVENFRKHPIGSGPWVFRRLVPGVRIEYDAWDKPHWRGTPSFRRLNILLVPEEATRIALVLSGHAALVAIEPESIPEIRRAGLRVLSIPGTMQAVLQFYGLGQPGYESSPLSDSRVREALSLAINRQEIINTLMAGEAAWPMPFATFRYSVDMDIAKWDRWSRENYRYDPARARELLKAAGREGVRITFWNTALPGTPYMLRIGEAVAGYWEKIGIQVDMRTMEWGTFDRMIRGDQKELVGTVSMFRTAGRPEASPRWHQSFHTAGQYRQFGRKGAETTQSRDFNRLYEEIISEPREAARLEKANRMLEMITKSWMGIPILEGAGYWAVNPKLVGAFKGIPGRHELGDVVERIPRPDQRPWP